VAVPAANAETTPEEEPTVNVADVPGLLHVPPGKASISVAEAPAHTLVVPDIIDGTGYTVTGIVAVHPMPVE